MKSGPLIKSPVSLMPRRRVSQGSVLLRPLAVGILRSSVFIVDPSSSILATVVSSTFCSSGNASLPGARAIPSLLVFPLVVGRLSGVGVAKVVVVRRARRGSRLEVYID